MYKDSKEPANEANERPAVSDWMLERYRLGELDAGQRAEIAKRLEADESLRARLFELDQDDAATLISYPPAKMADRFGRRQSPREERRSTVRWASTAAAAALLLVIGLGTFEKPVPDGERIKGDDTALVLFRQTGAEPERLSAGSVAQQGDVIQVGFKAPVGSYAAVVSVDGNGVITLHHPLKATHAAKVEASGRVLLPASYRLDDAPRFENFFLIYSKEPFPIEGAKEWLRVNAAADADARSDTSLQVKTFQLRKVSK